MYAFKENYYKVTYVRRKRVYFSLTMSPGVNVQTVRRQSKKKIQHVSSDSQKFKLLMALLVGMYIE